jgi:hypothetical protein
MNAFLRNLSSVAPVRAGTQRLACRNEDTGPRPRIESGAGSARGRRVEQIGLHAWGYV